MPPSKPLPCSDEFATPEEYVEELLEFTSTSETWQILCGGIHVVDFFITEPGLFYAALPAEWHEFLLSQDVMRLLDFFVRDDPETAIFEDGQTPPASLVAYIKAIRRLALRRDLAAPGADSTLPPLTRTVSVGMNPKKTHEVRRFADYVSRLSTEMAAEATEDEVTHFVDFGSGQNYLGRALASAPYNRRVVAVEGRQRNVDAAKSFDTQSGLAVKPKILRNKKVWNRILEAAGPNKGDPDALAAAIKQVVGDGDEGDNFRKIASDELSYAAAEEGKGLLQYVSGRLDDGDLSEVISRIDRGLTTTEAEEKEQQRLKLMAVSIHSCGNLTHHAIRSLVLNPDVHGVAIVGCCYNLVTEKLGPPPAAASALSRPTLQALNGRALRESERRDPHGFPMSARLSTHRGHGVRANATARMMACQAPQNWTRADSALFFTRHFYRAVLQKLLLDRGAVHEVIHDPARADADPATLGPFDKSTSPLAIGTLPKRCYAGGFAEYVRGAVTKLTTSTEYKKFAEVMRETMGGLTDEEVEAYEGRFAPRKRELCVAWSLMAYSATLVEALMVTDRWAWLEEQEEVDEAWVEAVFDFAQSPRNLVVVGLKKRKEESGGGGDGEHGKREES
ncbi:hypothetical protein ISF_01335 [Cordyceps fumosorosea ARSEF 2679]|uniref:Methyltransferase domain-containing protein n=1 Tax=Cordyceps fumosorosea (strain ARSEF 2679) TaxID=1081104 RepID=A0A162JQF5_CORFA|nr:hypothetical protein ISF_01335 [Cordyceps fumosorosea ARSEF 2679]OAA72262.1 hypothetical protein ISF_01335 [Cordyceps fumosorosea ARSEF 2679]